MLMTRRRLAQRLAFRVEMQRLGADAAHFEEMYQISVHTYVGATGATVLALDERQTPILDKIFEFIKWGYDSGFFAWLIGIFGSVVTEETCNTILAHLGET